MNWLSLAIIPAVALITLSQPGRAAPTLDQQFVVTANQVDRTVGNLNDGFPPLDTAQVFTVGFSGQLTAVVTQFGFSQFGTPSGDFTVRILPTVGGVPTTDFSAALASVAVPITTFPVFAFPTIEPFTTIDLSAAHLLVTTGEVLAIEMTSDTFVGAWDSEAPASYAGGNAYQRQIGDQWHCCGTNFDFPVADERLGFETFVDPSIGVPEPATLALFGSGLFGWLLLRRRAACQGSLAA